MAWMRISLALGALALTAGGAAAQPFPRYDVEQTCHPPATNGEYAVMSYKACIAAEQNGHDWAKFLWPRMMPDTKERCTALATKWGRAQYSYLGQCIIGLYENDQLRQQKPFHY